jgi:hypothetical protein
MLAVHRTFRREFGLLPLLVRATPADCASRAVLVAAHARVVLDAFERHHDGEDALVWPRLHMRADVPQALIYLMETQHAALADLVTLSRQLLDRWAATAAAPDRDQLGLVLETLSAALSEHLDDEERSLLPIAARNLTAAEWQQVGDREIASLPRHRLVPLLGALLEDASAAEQAQLLRRIPLTARVMYLLVGSRRYERRRASLRRDLASTPVRA